MIFKTFDDARKYNLTSDLIFLRPIMKVTYIKNCEAVYSFK